MFRNLCVVALLFTGIAPSHASIIDFDPAPLPGGSRLETSYLEHGVLFSGSFAHGSSLNSGRASNASSGYLEFLIGSSLRIEMSDSSLFSLGTVDLSEYSLVVAGPRQITFTGYYLNGSSISQTFVTDGLFDSVGGIEDFETFTFRSGFTNLTHVETRTNLFAMDNLEVKSAPSPGILVLFLLGIAGVAGFARSTRNA